MSLRTINRGATANAEYSYTVCWDAEWQEYLVTFYKRGIWMKDADYHTDDKQDALQSAAYWLNQLKKEIYS